MDIVIWECTDCALGEIKPCRFEGLREYADTVAISCPYGTHGEDAKWRIASVGMQWTPSSCGRGQNPGAKQKIPG